MGTPSQDANENCTGWPKLWANFKALIGIFSQSVGPSLAIWANPVQFSLLGQAARLGQSPAELTRAAGCHRRMHHGFDNAFAVTTNSVYTEVSPTGRAQPKLWAKF
jgi:hypothetical protein